MFWNTIGKTLNPVDEFRISKWKIDLAGKTGPERFRQKNVELYPQYYNNRRS